uniref:Uncharacterized protein n=1 Tax=Candida parapsilosis (strain CDC 317 / ATCC MYA-4646) TaxID=578454 RepID=A0AAJ8VWR3_CANPC
SCQRQKAPYQTYFKFASRFYTGYSTEFAKKSKQYTFTRNCFVRPEYNSSLKIVIKDHDNGAKSFKFRCTSCPASFKYPLFVCQDRFTVSLRMTRMIRFQNCAMR